MTAPLPGQVYLMPKLGGLLVAVVAVGEEVSWVVLDHAGTVIGNLADHFPVGEVFVTLGASFDGALLVA